MPVRGGEPGDMDIDAPPIDVPADHAVDGGDARTYRQLLTDRTFGPFFASAALSNTGSWFQNVAAGIVVFDLTGSNRAVGAFPGRLRGRVMALWSVAFLGCRPFAAIVDGTLADLFDVRTAIIVSSGVALATGITFWRIAPVGSDIAADEG